MSVIEVAIYALVLGHAAPALCSLGNGNVVTCSNGLVATVVAGDEARFNDGVSVRRRGNEPPVFSNGITSRLTRAGLLRFSNGIAVKRISVGRFDFDSGISCRAELPSLVDCAARPATP
jgi:hypothetical protein